MPSHARLLELALKGLEAERAQIDDEMAQIRNQIGSRPVVNSSDGNAESVPTRRRRRMSAAAKRKISQAMKRRYAAMRKSEGNPQQIEHRQIGLTAAGRKRLSALMKARWAKKRAAKKAA